MQKEDIVNVLRDIASLLELSEANGFEVMAFKNGADHLQDWEGDVEQAARDGTLTEIEGIGKGIASVVAELVDTGRSSKLEDMSATFPRSLLELRKVSGLGAKKVRLLYGELGVSTLDELETAIRAQRVRTLAGFSEKSEARLLEGIERARQRLA